MSLQRLSVILAVSWSLFQLSIAKWIIVDPVVVRAVHLAFGMSLAFLTLNSRGKAQTRLSSGLILALVGAGLSLYLIFDWQGLSARAGLPFDRDILIGVLLLGFLAEATRRSVGPALPVIAAAFSGLVFLGPYLPDAVSFPGANLSRYLSQITLSTEGIYGIPLDVSASTVFLFVLLGGILEKAGAGEFFTQSALALLGRFKGGPAKAAVVASGMTGLVSGSSISNIVTTGTFTIPLMKRSGFPAKKAAAIEVAASTDGQLMPPVMGAAAFIIAEYVNIPYLEVVKAALVPALLSYFALFFLTHLEADKLGMKGLPKSERPLFFPLFFAGFHHLIPIFVLGWELVVLRHSPKLAAFNAITVLVIMVFFAEYRHSKAAGQPISKAFKGTWDILISGMVQGAKNMVPVALATAAAGVIVGVVGLGIGGMLSSWVEQVSGGMLIPLLFVTAVASLLLGMGLPTTATYIVMASMTAPIIYHLGLQGGWGIPLIAAHLFCFYFGILADDTPPVGLASYAAAAIAESDPIQTGLQGFWYDLRTAIIPFMFVLNPELLLYGVDSWGSAAWILFRGTCGALAFTALLQGWLLTRNRIWEMPILGFCALLLFHPKIFSAFGDLTWVGFAGLAVLVSSHLWRKRTA